MCKEDKMICSNEGKTYPTICSLNEEAIERGEPGFNSPKLFMEYWGPCKEGKLPKSINSLTLIHLKCNNSLLQSSKNLHIIIH